MDKYNGWSNRDTWLAFTWLSNDEDSYKKTLAALSNYPLLVTRISMMKLVLQEVSTDKIDFIKVDWQEVIEGFAEDMV